MKSEVNNPWLLETIERLRLDDCPQLKSVAINEVKNRTGKQNVPFPLTSASELTKQPSYLHWLIKGIVLRNSLAHLFGPPGSLKSFIALWMGYCIATGKTWNDRKVESGAVIYLAGEGYHGMKSRLRALENHFGLAADNLFISQKAANLTDAENINQILESIKMMGLDVKIIIVDTLHRNAGDVDENSASDFAKVLSSLDHLMFETGAAVLIVHHSGHGSTDRARGSSAMRGAMDNEYSVVLKDGIATMTCTKSKESEAPQPMRFKPLTVDTGWLDEDGFPVTSLVLEDVGSFYETQTAKLTPLQQRALTDLGSLIWDEGVAPAQGFIDELLIQHIDTELPTRVIDEKVWRKSFTDNYIEDGKLADSAGRSFRRMKNDLLDAKAIHNFQDYVWLS